MGLKQKRILVLCLSIPCMGLGVALFVKSALGADPYTLFNMAVAAKTGLSFGTASIMDNMLLLVLVLLFHRSTLGIGTVLNMVGVGYLVDFFSWAYDCAFPAPATLPIQLVLLVLGVLILSFAASLYFTVALGLAPYDTLAFMFEKLTHWSFSWCRICTDGTALVLGLLLGGSAGIGTFVCACCLGPFITFFNNKVSIPLLGARRIKAEHQNGE